MSSHLMIVDVLDVLRRACATTPEDRFTPDGLAAHGLYASARWLRWAQGGRDIDHAVAVIPAKHASSELAVSTSVDLAQLRVLRRFLEGLGWTSVQAPPDRCADAVAGYAEQGALEGLRVSILGCDKRFAALVRPGIWWCDPYKRVRYTEAIVRKRFGVPPTLIGDWLALVGDVSTPVEGVRGIGAKGATTLLTEFGSIEAVIAQIETPDPERPTVPKRVIKALTADPDHVRHQRRLSALDSTGLIRVPLSELSFQPSPVPERNLAYVELGFFELLEADPDHAFVCDVAGVSGVDADIGTDDPWLVQHGDTFPSIHALSEDPSPVRGGWVGLAVFAGGRARFFRELGPNLRAWLVSSAPKVGHDVKATMVALHSQGCDLGGVVGDSTLASHLLDPSGSAPHELAPLVRRTLHQPLPEVDELLGTGRGRKCWADLSIQDVANYAGQCAAAAGRLWHAFLPQISPARWAESWALSRVLVQMELAGMKVSRESLAEVGTDFAAITADLETTIFEFAGRSFNIGSSKQLSEVLFTDLQLPVLARTKTGWSTATHVLERLSGEHPIIAPIIRHRRLQRLQSTWVNALSAAIGDDGRVHSTFHPARSFSGRLVNSHPDLGRVPGRTPEMNRIRQAFVAPAGQTLLSVDYDQLGLYVLAHLTGDPALVEPLEAGADMHVQTASAVLQVAASGITEEQRQIGKVVNFATFAGQGASALRQQLGVSIDDAKAMIARFDERYAVARRFQEDQLAHCREHGYVTTITGRRWPIRDVRSNDPHLRGYGERLARRAPHEGSVADVTRRGLLRAAEALATSGLHGQPLLQIHDEILFEVPKDELEQTIVRVCEAMRGAFDLRVPLRVSVKTGPTWGDLERRPDVSGGSA